MVFIEDVETHNQTASILLVEDDPDTRFATGRLLRQAGFAVQEACSAAEGLQKARQEKPTLVLLDCVLPDGGGEDICRRLKADDSLRDTFVVLISALRTNTDEQAAGLEAGADGYIARPVGNRELLERVQLALRLQASQAGLRQRLEDLTQRLFQVGKLDAIGRLACGIAHDFNNQLAAILGYSDMLAQRLSDPALARYAKTIEAASRRSAALTRQLLTMVHVEDTPATPVALHDVIHEVASMLERVIGPHIDVCLELEAENPFVDGDAAQLHHALLNLGVNARDAMPEGGHLSFRTTQRVIHTALPLAADIVVQPGTYVVLEVHDTGSGMDEATQHQALMPFFTTKGKGQGTGLGLASVKQTVLNHSGVLNLLSEPGKGTTFELYLPLSAAMGENASQPAAKLTTGKAQILVVEDTPMSRQMTSEMLELLGYEVTALASGVAALDYYREHWEAVDLVMLDMLMPKLGGAETFRAMRALNPGLRALLFSGASVDEHTQALLQEGAVSFLAKPFDQATLSMSVAQALAPAPVPPGRAPPTRRRPQDRP